MGCQAAYTEHNVMQAQHATHLLGGHVDVGNAVVLADDGNVCQNIDGGDVTGQKADSATFSNVLSAKTAVQYHSLRSSVTEP